MMAQKGSLEDFLAMAVEAAKNAGEIIRSGFYETKKVEHKGGWIWSQRLTRNVRNLYSTFSKKNTLTIRYPFVCVSIGLTIERIPTVGVVYNPIMEELFTAIRGKGAFLNGKPIKASCQTELMKSLLSTAVGTKRDKATVDASTNRINSLLSKVRSLRMSGSCALCLCGIACGRIDLFYLQGFGPWDVAAGAVIVNEAGGLVFDPSGKDFDITSQQIAASNPLIKDKFVEALQQSE